MKDIPDGSVDLVLTDPPYGTTACKWDTVIPFEPLWEQYNRERKKKIMSDVERITWAHQDARRMEDEMKKMDEQEKPSKRKIALHGCFFLMGTALAVAMMLFSEQRFADGLALVGCSLFFLGAALAFED